MRTFCREMTPEEIAVNQSSWLKAVQRIEELSHPSFDPWRTFEKRFINCGISRNFDLYFRAGTSILDRNYLVGPSLPVMVFSTLDHHGLDGEPSITIGLTQSDLVRLTYWPGIPAQKKDEKLDYTLKLESAIPTFHRFLNHLWEMTKPEPLPSDLRSPENPYTAPIMAPNLKITQAEQDDLGNTDKFHS